MRAATVMAFVKRHEWGVHGSAALHYAASLWRLAPCGIFALEGKCA